MIPLLYSSRLSRSSDSALLHLSGRPASATCRAAALALLAVLALSVAAPAEAAPTRTRTPTPRPTPRLVGIKLEPATATRAVGESRTFLATGTLSDGTTRNVTQQLVYKSSNTQVAEATNQAGNRSLVEAVGPGDATISVTDPVTGVGSHQSHGDAVLTVFVRPTATPTPRPTRTVVGQPTRTRTPTPRPTPRLVAIKLEPATTSRLVGQTRTYLATATLSDGSTRIVTQQLVYESSDPRVAEATNQTGNRSLVRAVGPGAATISAKHLDTEVTSTASGGDGEMTVRTEAGGSPGGPTPRTTPFGMNLEDAARAKLADECHGAIAEAGARLLTRELAALTRCAGGLAKCVQATADGPKRQTCTGAAAARCATELSKVAGERVRLGASIRARCDRAPLAVADLLSARGLGFGGVAEQCGAASEQSIVTFDDIVTCLSSEIDCRAEGLLDLLAPRAKELLRVADVAAEPPDPLPCLEDHGGSGEGVSDTAGDGRALARCERALKRAGVRFVARKLDGMKKCVGKVFDCIQTQPSDPACVTSKARVKCAKAFARLADEEIRLDGAVRRGCGELDFASTLRAPNAANLGALSDACAVVGVADLAGLDDYGRCLFRALDCAASELLRIESPRAGELLSLVRQRPVSSFCPTPAATPTATSTAPTPTAGP